MWIISNDQIHFASTLIPEHILFRLPDYVLLMHYNIKKCYIVNKFEKPWIKRNKLRGSFPGGIMAAVA